MFIECVYFDQFSLPPDDAYRLPFGWHPLSKLLVENFDIFIPHLCLAASQGVTPSEFREDLDIHKTRMNGLSCCEETMAIYVQPF